MATGKQYGHVTRNTPLHNGWPPKRKGGAARLVAPPSWGIAEFAGSIGERLLLILKALAASKGVKPHVQAALKHGLRAADNSYFTNLRHSR